MLAEAKQFVGLHARFMGLDPSEVDGVLDRIGTLDGEGRGSWVAEWSAAADRHVRAGKPRAASNLYNLARFPRADSPARREAGELAAQSLHTWLLRSGAGERRTATVDGHEVPFLYQCGPRPDAPLVIMMGGIVSLKEQWGGFLQAIPRTGSAVAIVDFPGVGENGVPYSRSAGKVFTAVMDTVADSCAADRTLAVALSFGGHLAMVQSQADPRIRKVVTVGSPISRSFTDPAALAAMPRITRAALSHTSGVASDALDQHLSELALRPQEIADLKIPVRYVASLRDEIIPQDDWREAARLHDGFHVNAFDDVHGSPHHLRETRVIILGELLRHGGRTRLARLVEQLGRKVLRITHVPTASSHHPR
ncbi:alpha/beta hydrolase [Streptomyces sp. MK5]|uniref:alpha/beta hydrolase n=1 Tax=Streptomyces sp. MK5 TaxID=3064253 RepID=UPI0027428FC3|nr:alpha/beta hydrolase [Streptomyces sp. MK5]